MKTKAYKLAAELGLQEQSVLDWLRENGYPNVRRADMIRSEVAQAARKALGQMRSAMTRGVATASSLTRSAGRPDKSFNDTRRRGPPGSTTQGDGFRVTFAELLDEAGGQIDAQAASGPVPVGAQAKVPGKSETISVDRRLSAALDELRLELAQGEKERDDLRQAMLVEQANTKSVERTLAQLQTEAVKNTVRARELEKVSQERDRLSLECASLLKNLRQAEDENATLQGTCSDLQGRLLDLDNAVDEMESLQMDHSVVLGDLETARQRETAWRTRALELERVMQSGGGILDFFGALGVSGLPEQVRLLAALSGNEGTAIALSQAVRSFDEGALEKLFKDKARPTCTHVVCQRVIAQRGLQAYRVDSAEHCAVCSGRADHRWFRYFAHQCFLSGVKRVLVVGGSVELHETLREFSEGHSVELRLLTADDRASEGRIRGRVEGCDLLVLAERGPTVEATNQQYTDAARRLQRLVVSPIHAGSHLSLGLRTLALASVNVLARAQVLTPI